jgi:N-acyl-D-aspartate/D-glutamate deacylase
MPDYDLLIRGADVIDGSGAPRYTADVAVRDGWDFADALHHSIAAGCEAFATFDTRLARRARRDAAIDPPVIAL